MEQPQLKQVLRWLIGVTRPVHPPLLVCASMRCLSLLIDITLFGCLGAGTIMLIRSEVSPLPLFTLLAFLALSKAVTYYFEQFSGHYVAFKALELLRTYLFSTLWPKYPYAAHINHSGDLVASLTRDVDRVEVVYAHTFAPVVAAYVVPTVTLVGVGIGIGWEYVPIVAICVLLSLTVVPWLGVRRSFEASRQNLMSRRQLASHISDSIYGIEEIVGYGRQSERLEQMARLGHAVDQADHRARLWVGVRRGTNLLLMLVAVSSLMFVSDSDPALLLGLMCAYMRLFEAPRGVEDAISYLDKSLASARRLFQIRQLENPVVDGSFSWRPQTAVSVTYDRVTYRYPGADQSRPACLRDLSLEVAAGSHTVIRGSSGLGKTTLLKLLLRFDNPSSGSICVDGIALDNLRLDDLRQAVALVGQHSDFIAGTVRVNLQLACQDADEEQMWWALERAGLAEDLRAAPQGLDTEVGGEFLAISGGQARRLDLARALLRRPRLLLLDEFTAGLNRELEADIRERLEGMAEQFTIIEVCHHSSGLRGHEKIVNLSELMTIS